MKNKRVILITGANGGLGKYITNAFLKNDAVVVGASLSIDKSEFDSENFFARKARLSDQKSIELLVKSVVEEFGKIDALIHTVGGYAGGKSIVETDDETFEQMFDLNVRTSFYLFRAVIPLMQKAKSGRIVAVGSRSAVEPSPRSALYGASKAALVSMVKSAAAENKDTGVSINAILPETIDTPRNRELMPYSDFSKWVSPEQIAQTIIWLSSDSISDINGVLIPVYGRN